MAVATVRPAPPAGAPARATFKWPAAAWDALVTGLLLGRLALTAAANGWPLAAFVIGAALLAAAQGLKMPSSFLTVVISMVGAALMLRAMWVWLRRSSGGSAVLTRCSKWCGSRKKRVTLVVSDPSILRRSSSPSRPETRAQYWAKLCKPKARRRLVRRA